MYQAVIFDLDGTLIDSMWVWAKIDEIFLGKRNIQTKPEMHKVLEGKSFTESAQYFKSAYPLNMSIEEIKKEWNELAWNFYTQDVKLKEGARAFLELLKTYHIKMGIATSNSIELVTAVLTALDIEPYFSQIRTSCEVGRGKPFPDIYLKVADDLKVDPKACLVFEDIPNGIRAGQRAGMTVWGIRDVQDHALWDEVVALADDIVQDYKEAKNKFEKVLDL